MVRFAGWRVMGALVVAVGLAMGQAGAPPRHRVDTSAGDNFPVVDGAMKLTGQTAPAAKVEVPSVLRGQLSEVDVREGDTVKRGQVIAKLDDALQQGAVKLAQLAAENDAAVQYAQADIKFAQNDYDQVVKAGSGSNPTEVNQKALALTKAKITLTNEQSLLAQAKIKLQQEQTTLDRMTIKSPIDGQIYRLKKHAGEETDENPVAIVVETDKLNVQFLLPGSLFGRVKNGEKVTLTLETDPKPIQREAVVTGVDPVVDPSGLFQVMLEMDNADGAVPAGIQAVWNRAVK